MVESYEHRFLAGDAKATSYADAKGQFGNSVAVSFGRGGGAAVAHYSATFENQTETDVIKTRMSNCLIGDAVGIARREKLLHIYRHDQEVVDLVIAVFYVVLH